MSRRFRLIKSLLKNRGEKSMVRILLDISVEGIRLNGLTLDLGSFTNPLPSYYEHFKSIERERVITVDFVRDKEPHVLANVEVGLPFKDNSVKQVLMFSLLEHVYKYQNVCLEAYRVLEPGGTCYISVPFLLQIHNVPFDYFRYSGEALYNILHDVGFSEIKVESWGFGPFTLAWGFLPKPFLFRLFYIPLVILSLILDELIAWRQKDRNLLAPKYPFRYFVTCIKGD